MTPADLERLFRHDPAGRGLLSADGADRLCTGHLADAAAELTISHARVALVTGFFVPDADPPAAETDGLVGSLLLADVLRHGGADVCLITDKPCASALTVTLDTSGCRSIDVLVCPLDRTASAAWMREFSASPIGQRLTHLIAIERPAPTRDRDGLSGRCCNMRGVDIDDSTADLYRLFEDRPHPGMCTIGIGDGGNEIGMGSLPWTELAGQGLPANVIQFHSRTSTDWTILAGTSDWGAFALAAAVCLHRGDVMPLVDWTADRIERLLAAAVTHGPAIDGLTRQPTPTVDGLPFITYIQPWLHVREQLLG